MRRSRDYELRQPDAPEYPLERPPNALTALLQPGPVAIEAVTVHQIELAGPE